MMVPSQTLAFPNGNYGVPPLAKEQEILPLAAHWSTKGMRFFQVNKPPRKVRVTLLVDPGVEDEELPGYCFKQFRGFAGPAHGKYTNYDVATMLNPNTVYIKDPINRDTLKTAMEKHKGAADLFLFLLNAKDYDPYAIFKDLADRDFGLNSISVSYTHLTLPTKRIV